jgi:hypothetical protein
MAKKLQLRGGTTSEHASFTGAVREVTVDTDKDTLVVHDGSTAGGIPLAKASEATNKLPLAGGEMTGNISHGDNVHARFGTGNDLDIYHDGSHSWIKDNGTGNIIIDTTNGTEVNINSGGNAEFMGRFIKDGAVKLYFDNSKKIETTSTGVDVTGNVVVSGTVDGVDIASRDSTLTSTTTTAGAALPKAGGTITGNIAMGDNVSANFGASNDLQIYHSGSASYISDVGTGSLYLRGTNLVMDSATGEKYIDCIANADVKLFYDNSSKLATTSTGIDVTGTVVADGLEIESNVPSITLKDTDNPTGEMKLRGANTEFVFDFDPSNAVANSQMDFKLDGSSKMKIKSTGIDVTGNVVVSGTVDGRDVATDGTKLDGVASSATNVTNNNQITNGAGYITSYTNTTYSAGLGLGMSGTTLNVEFDSTASEGAMKNVSGTISVYASSSWRQIYPAVYS